MPLKLPFTLSLSKGACRRMFPAPADGSWFDKLTTNGDKLTMNSGKLATTGGSIHMDTRNAPG